VTGHFLRQAEPGDLDVWVDLRHALWPQLALEGHRVEITEGLEKPERFVAFLCFDPDGRAVGLAEASIRFDHVNGCERSPVAFLEGIVVAPSARRTGVARLLVSAVSDWARSKGVSELASDADLDNTTSHAMHAALGFDETQRVVYFRKAL
jgi:aminoglycoside 6'-N-acetyltransferase I